MNILSSENFNNIIFILVPGFITTNLIDIISPPKKYREFIYVVKCLFYGLLVCFITKYFQNLIIQTVFIPLFVVSILLGIVIGLIKQNKIVNKILASIGIKTITSIPSAWDDIFSRQYYGFIIVTLIDGTVIKGLLHNHSIVGDEIQDLYLEKLYYKRGKNEWYSDEINAGIYIAKNQISRIEFLKENDNGKQKSKS